MTLEQALKDWQDELEDARREAWRLEEDAKWQGLASGAEADWQLQELQELEEAQRQHEAQQRPLSQRIKLDA